MMIGVDSMIKGKRIYIKKFESVDEVIMHSALYNNIEERSIHDHNETKDVEKRIQDFNNGLFDGNENAKYMIFNMENEFIGTIGFVRKSEFEVNVGYRLMKHKHRQQGYISEALPLFVQYVFENMDHVDRISLNTAYDNIGSQKVATRSGFTFEGVLRKAYEYRGNRVDFFVYSILREEYKNIPPYNN